MVGRSFGSFLMHFNPTSLHQLIFLSCEFSASTGSNNPFSDPIITSMEPCNNTKKSPYVKIHDWTLFNLVASLQHTTAASKMQQITFPTPEILNESDDGNKFIRREKFLVFYSAQHMKFGLDPSYSQLISKLQLL